MNELLKCQQVICDNVFLKIDDLGFIKSDFPQERFNIYRQTILENMINALKITYPDIWILLGEECANSVAYAYIAFDDNLPKTGCLDDFGENFFEFLSTLDQLKDWPYLSDYARYEWLKHLANMSADSSPINPSDLINIKEDEIDNIAFNFCPSVFLFYSKYPLFDIHEVVQDTSGKPITLSNQGAYGVIVRNNEELHTYWIAEDIWHFINKLYEGSTLSESELYVNALSESFDLSMSIAFILQTNLVDKIINVGESNVC